MISGSQCWYFTKTNMPLPQKGLAPIFIAPPTHTYATQATISSVKQSKTNVTHLSRRNKQPRRPIAGLPAPWVLSSAGKLIQYLHGSYFLPYRNTVSTLDASGAITYYRTHYNQWCCLHWMGHDKSLTVNCCSVLFMTYWHKFRIIFNGRLSRPVSVDRL